MQTAGEEDESVEFPVSIIGCTFHELPHTLHGIPLPLNHQCS